ncbi:MAG: hypothetical protein ACLQOO_00230 [Terriglobia bacterium]
MSPESFSIVSNPRVPAAAELVPAWVRGERANRLMVILRAPGCAYDLRREGGCTYCGFRKLTTNGTAVSPDDLTAQVDHALLKHDCASQRIFELDVYNSGNFLNDSEVPAEARTGIFRRISGEPAVRVVVVESRPEYITTERLRPLVNAGVFALEVGIGLECVDDVIREKYLRKGFTRRAFEHSVRTLKSVGADLLAYVMIKPMPMSDQVALREAVRSAQYIHEVASQLGVRARIALQPTFVVPGTPLAREFEAGHYSPPPLALVMETARQIAPFGDLVVGLWDEELDPLAVPNESPDSHGSLVERLRRFNQTQGPAFLDVRGGGGYW